MLKNKLNISFIIILIVIFASNLAISSVLKKSNTKEIELKDKHSSIILNDELDFSDSNLGIEHQEFNSQRLKPVIDNSKINLSNLSYAITFSPKSSKLEPSSTSHITNKNNHKKVSTIQYNSSSSALVAALLKKTGLSTAMPTSQDSSFYKTSKSPVKKVLKQYPQKKLKTIKLYSSTKSSNKTSNNLITTTPISLLSYDDEIITKNFHQISSQSFPSAFNISNKKAKYVSSLLSTIDTNAAPTLVTSTPQATEQHSVMINHGGGAISTIRRTLNSNHPPAFEHIQIGFQPPIENAFSKNPLQNFNLGLDFTPPPPIEPVKPNIQKHSTLSLIPLPKISPPSSSINQNSYPIISNKPVLNIYKKPFQINKRKSSSFVKDANYDLNHNQILPVSVGISDSFSNVKPADLPNLAELSFFGYRKNSILPRVFHEEERYNINKENNNQLIHEEKKIFHNNFNDFNYKKSEKYSPHLYNIFSPLVTTPSPPASPILPASVSHPIPPNYDNKNNLLYNHNNNENNYKNEVNFNIHPFFAPNTIQPPNNELFGFFSAPFLPITSSNADSKHFFNQNQQFNSMHRLIHHKDDNNIHNQLNNYHHQVFHNQDNNQLIGNDIGLNNLGQFFQRRKLTLNSGNVSPILNEISNNNLGYGYPSYSIYKNDEEAGIKWPKIFKFTDGRMNLNEFEKEKKLGKIVLNKNNDEDEYNFENVRRDLFLILHGGSFSY